MLDPITIRLAQIMTEERLEHLNWREPSLVFRYRGFRWHRSLLSNITHIVSHLQAKIVSRVFVKKAPASFQDYA